MTKKQIEKFAVRYPYPTNVVECVLVYCDWDTDKAHAILCDRERTIAVFQKQRNNPLY